MPNPLNPSPALLGLQKATSIGPDRRAEAFRQMEDTRKDAAMPPPGELFASLTNLGKLAVPSLRRGAASAAETLGEMSPEFTAVGGEGMYNIGKGVRPSTAPYEVYQRMMEKFGMGR